MDANRIYGTGQSMGAMTTLYFVSNNPDLYAATLIVDGQWDVAQLPDIATQKMIYIAAGGDQNALSGQNAVKALLESKNIPFSSISGLDAQASPELVNNDINKMLSEGNALNFITWEAGTVLGSNTQSNSRDGEHMASFDYGYKLSSVRDWIFEQHK